MPRSKKSDAPHFNLAQWKRDNPIAVFINANKNLGRVRNGFIIEFATRMKGDGDSRMPIIHMSVNIPEGASANAIKQAATWIFQWRERLTKFQGPSHNHGYNALYARLATSQQQGRSYADIARYLNAEIASILAQCFASNGPKFLAQGAAGDLMMAMGMGVSRGFWPPS